LKSAGVFAHVQPSARQAHTSVPRQAGKGAPKERTRARQERISAVLCPKADMLHEFTELAVYALLPRTRFIRRYSVTAMPAIEQEARSMSRSVPVRTDILKSPAVRADR
jgi:hypothetical protein